MKTNTFQRFYLLLLLIANMMFTHQIVAQPYPPAQGPPPPTNPVSELGTFFLINSVENSIKTTVDTVNARIQRDKGETGVNAKLSFSFETFKPGMSVTTYPDRPNQNIVRIAFIVKYNVTDISYKGVPYFSRTLHQSIEVNVACKDWFTNNGRLNISARIDEPYLDNASFSEQVLNFFIANTLTDFVDSKIRSTLPAAFQTSNDVLTAPCNCLGVNGGTKAAKYKDGAVLFSLKKGSRIIGGQTAAFTTATVKVLKIKRLQARSFPGNQILYNEVENIQLEFFANQNHTYLEIHDIREGEERNLTAPAISFPKPADNATVILIANIEQAPLTSNLKDTQFNVYNKSNNFGNGIQKLIITKPYWTKPQRLPGGGMTKPTEMKVPAYELTVQVTMPQQSVIMRN